MGAVGSRFEKMKCLLEEAQQARATAGTRARLRSAAMRIVAGPGPDLAARNGPPRRVTMHNARARALIKLI